MDDCDGASSDALYILTSPLSFFFLIRPIWSIPPRSTRTTKETNRPGKFFSDFLESIDDGPALCVPVKFVQANKKILCQGSYNQPLVGKHLYKQARVSSSESKLQAFGSRKRESVSVAASPHPLPLVPQFFPTEACIVFLRLSYQNLVSLASHEAFATTRITITLQVNFGK